MKRVLKYSLTPDCVVEMPRGAKILSVQVQRDTPCIWALCQDDNQLDGRRFMIYGTGHAMPEDLDLRYLGTFQLQAGNFVFHVFEDADFPYRIQE